MPQGGALDRCARSRILNISSATRSWRSTPSTLQGGPMVHTLSLSSDFNEHRLTGKFESRDVINLTDLGDATVIPGGKSSGYQISCVLSEGATDLTATSPVLHFTNKANQIEGKDNSSFSGFTITTTKSKLGFR